MILQLANNIKLNILNCLESITGEKSYRLDFIIDDKNMTIEEALEIFTAEGALSIVLVLDNNGNILIQGINRYKAVERISKFYDVDLNPRPTVILTSDETKYVLEFEE